MFSLGVLPPSIMPHIFLSLVLRFYLVLFPVCPFVICSNFLTVVIRYLRICPVLLLSSHHCLFSFCFHCSCVRTSRCFMGLPFLLLSLFLCCHGFLPHIFNECYPTYVLCVSVIFRTCVLTNARRTNTTFCTMS
jgi:hypothetical protein